jgi:hypothetical protein
MPPTTLYRLTGRAGVVTGVLLLFNDARRVGLVPENAFTHAIAPIAAFFAPFVITGIYLWQRDRVGALGLWGYVLNCVGLIGAAAIEFTGHWVFPFLGKETVTSLVDGRTGLGFLIIAVVYLIGIVLFGFASWRAGVLPQCATVIYVAGFAPTALRGVVPDAVVSAGFVLGAVAVIGFSVALVQAKERGSVLNRPGGHREHGTAANTTPPRAASGRGEG